MYVDVEMQSHTLLISVAGGDEKPSSSFEERVGIFVLTFAVCVMFIVLSVLVWHYCHRVNAQLSE